MDCVCERGGKKAVGENSSERKWEEGMSDMVRLAAKKMGDVYELFGQTGDLRTERLRQPLLEAMARAAIAAMREPTDDMIEAAHHRLAGDGTVEDVYRAMIDAALSASSVGKK
jgi:hypothetical protein